MTITVTSTTDLPENVAAASALPTPPAPAPEVPPAPEAPKAPDENASADSEPAEPEAKEGDAEGEGDESEPKVEGEDKPVKKKGGFQRRIDKLNARVSAKEQELEYWKQQALKGAGAPKIDAPVEQTAKTAAAEGEPQPDQYESHADFVKALARWEAKQEFNERDQKAERSRLEIEQSKAVNTYAGRAKAFAEKHADFDDVMADASDIPLSPAVREIILTSDDGPELAYELAKNPDEAKRIALLGPLAAAREIGKIEAKIAAKASAGKQPEPKKQTQAPQPITPVGSKGGAVRKTEYDAESMSQREYEELRAKQRASKR